MRRNSPRVRLGIAPARAPGSAGLRAATALALAALLSVSCATPQAVSSFRTTDGFTIFADVHLPPSRVGRSPLVVLSHQLGRDRHSWDAFVPRLLQAGYAVVAVDQRGFGQSVREAASPAQLSLEAKERLDLDLLGAIRFAARRGVDTTRVAVIGTGVSATAAVRCARENPSVRAVAFLVATLDPDAEEFLIDRPDLPLLMVAAAGDERGTALMRQYGERFTGPRQQYFEMPKVSEADAADWRGTDGLAGDTGLADLMLWFLERNLPVPGREDSAPPSGTRGVRGSR